jgi:hypothetical protein
MRGHILFILLTFFSISGSAGAVTGYGYYWDYIENATYQTHNGTWRPNYEPDKFQDGNWGSPPAHCNIVGTGNGCWIWENYTLPTLSTIVKEDTLLEFSYDLDNSVNYTWSDIQHTGNCFGYNNDQSLPLWLRFYHNYSGGVSNPVTAWCYNFDTKDWDELLSGNPNGYLYESGLYLHRYKQARHYDSLCDSSNEWIMRCGGENADEILTCINDSGVFTWDDDTYWCEDGCYNATCSGRVLECSSRCTNGQTKCFGDNVITCAVDSDGCYNWDGSTVQKCDRGCIGGVCITNISQCNEGDYRCGGKHMENCVSDGWGNWNWNRTSWCEYGCEESLFINGSLNLTCRTIGDTHTIANSLTDAITYGVLIFRPVIIGAYMIFSLVVSLALGFFSKSYQLSPMVMIGFMIGGTIWGVLPFFVSFIFSMVSLFWFYKVGDNGH